MRTESSVYRSQVIIADHSPLWHLTDFADQGIPDPTVQQVRAEEWALIRDLREALDELEDERR